VGTKKHTPDENEFVFFIRHKDDDRPHGMVLIGASTAPTKTAKEMQDLSPVTLVYLGSVRAKDYPERWWQQSLLPWLVRETSLGAWYKPSAQVLCLIEDVLGRRILPPGQCFDVLERIPAHIRPLTLEEQKRRKWEFPRPDPYPLPSPESARRVSSSIARRLALRVLASSPEALSTPSRDLSLTSSGTSHLVETLKAS
jgi:hypothetical protein